MISTDNTTVVSYINKQGGTHSPTLCIEVWEILHWCLEHNIILRMCHISGKSNILEDGLLRLDNSQYRIVLGSSKLHFSNAQISQCGFVCDSVQPQTPIVCLSSSGQWSLCDRCLIHELKQSTCLWISSNSSDTIYSHQNLSILVQNSSNAPLWPQSPWFSEVLQLLVWAPIWLPYFPNFLTQAMGKFQY